VDSCWAALWEQSGKDDPPRGYAFAVVKLPDGRNLFLYSFHFKANSRTKNESNISKREEASRQMLSHAEDMAKIYPGGNTYPVIFAGDFNTDPEDQRFSSRETTSTSFPTRV
jgi:endonuclease/exonuclease/phosphatase family metal-dependent hydrolase